MKSVLSSVQSKGLLNYLRRGQTITKSYGLTTSKMAQALDLFSQVLRDFRCGATFPITAVALKRNSKVVENYVGQGIEFAIHGYRHIDYSQLVLEEQVVHLRHAHDTFTLAGFPFNGFRSPYLRFNEHLHEAAREVGLVYLSNQPILWDVLDGESFSPAAQTAYRRALALYTPWSADEQPALPQLWRELVEIPVSLPDDEMLLDRLGGETDGLVERAWSRILVETYRREELFTLQLHPERIARCASALRALLAQARALNPPVWVACLGEMAAWWRARSAATVMAAPTGDGKLCLSLRGPDGMAFLARNVETDMEGLAQPWTHGYQRYETQSLILASGIRPFIGVPAGTAPELVYYLREQGYIVEVSDNSQNYSVYLDHVGAIPENRRPLLAQVEEGNQPLVKLGRWPGNNHSALAITGDIDALTLWDYGLRYLGY
jgi:peptidoglycan/xylan/chitin deacetylase (PgdA/CDA1 family)